MALFYVFFLFVLFLSSWSLVFICTWLKHSFSFFYPPSSHPLPSPPAHYAIQPRGKSSQAQRGPPESGPRHRYLSPGLQKHGMMMEPKLRLILEHLIELIGKKSIHQKPVTVYSLDVFNESILRHCSDVFHDPPSLWRPRYQLLNEWGLAFTRPLPFSFKCLISLLLFALLLFPNGIMNVTLPGHTCLLLPFSEGLCRTLLAH